MRISSYLTDEELATMSSAELESWSETQAIGPWTPNVPTGGAADHPPRALTIRVRPELAVELEVEAARQRRDREVCAGDLLLLGLRTVQARRLGRRA